MAVNIRRLEINKEIVMKILIADDHELFLKGLELVLTDYNSDWQIVSAKSYTDIFTILKKENKFDLILTDLAMPGSRWLDAIQSIHDILPETPIIILSAVFDKEVVQKTIEIGAAGYIPKTSSNAVILSAINLVISGGVYIPAELLQDTNQNEFDVLKQVEKVSSADNVAEKMKILSPRQIDVIKLISKGKSNKQIAYELGLTEGTVKLHVTAILKLLNVYNRTGAVVEATKLGLIND
ncbi:MAG: response regulator transcription factor [Alphaproteobacteria bacterium]|nr:response regulator transcription factor [Alphaproteobacteria bacterium]